MAKPRTRRRIRLNILPLEDRRVPANWGIPWPDAQHLTASFVPDGTTVQSQQSQLNSTLDAELGAGRWEKTILSAIQTWASRANINIGLVPDGGQPLGVAGPAEGDPRFGDIRISAAPLSAGTLAITAPYDPSVGTLSGDMIINSNVDFNPADPGSYDLYTVALHEAGHIFGFADSIDPANFMYDGYTGPVTGLQPAAVNALDAVYGGPAAIAKGGGSNGPGTAVPGTGQGFVAMDSFLSANQATATYPYKLQDKLDYSSGIDAKVQVAGTSLLVPTVTIYDANGNVLASGVGSGPTRNDVSLHFNPVNDAKGKLQGNYSVVISGGTGVFGSGAFRVTIQPTISGGSAAFAGIHPQPIANEGSNYDGSAPLTAYNNVTQFSQSDVYSFTAPALGASQMTAYLRSTGVGTRPAQLTIYDAGQNAVASAVATNSSGRLSLNLANIVPGGKYFVRVDEGLTTTNGLGNYRLMLSFSGQTTTTSDPTDIALSMISTIPTSSHDAKSGAVTAFPNLGSGATSGHFLASLTASAPSATYTVQPSKLPHGSTASVYLTVTVMGLDGDGFAPGLVVTTPQGATVPNVLVLEAEGGTTVLQLPVTATDGPNSGYQITVNSGVPGSAVTSGNFYLGATFGGTSASLQKLMSGGLYPSSDPATYSFSTSSDQLSRFVLTSSSPSGSIGQSVQLNVLDANGNVVGSVSEQANTSVSFTVNLPAGSYTLQVALVNPTGSTVQYTVYGENLTDPIRVYGNSGGGSDGGRH